MIHGPVLLDILEKRETDKTHNAGGLPHTFVERLGGYIIPTLYTSPDPITFRGDYYYNASDNNLYAKLAVWTDLHKEFSEEDNKYVYYNGRSVIKLMKDPDPKNFGDIYFYSISRKSVYGKTLTWVKIENLLPAQAYQ